MLGIIASTEIEVALFLKHLRKTKKRVIQGKSFYKGFLKNIEVSISVCGIGKANAAHGTTLLIERFKPELVYIVGIAGAYPSSKLNIGDIAVAEREIYADEGLVIASKRRREIFYTMDSIKLPFVTTNGKNYYNEFPMYIPQEVKSYTGNFVTVSTCTGTLRRAKEIEKRFNAICENMEGAAVAHICALSGIHAVEIRAISNIIKDRQAKPLNKRDIFRAAENVQIFFLENIIQ